MTKTRLPALEQRWANELASFNFTIKYRPAKHNQNADALSRLEVRPWEAELYSIAVKDLTSMQVAVELPQQLQQIAWSNIKFEECIPEQPNPKLATSLPWLSSESVQKLQETDPMISRVIFYFQKGVKPSHRETINDSKEVKLLLRQWDRLFEENSILYRRAKDQPGTLIQLLIIPRALKEKILKGFHDQSGHQGRDHTERLIQSK